MRNFIRLIRDDDVWVNTNYIIYIRPVDDNSCTIYLRAVHAHKEESYVVESNETPTNLVNRIAALGGLA